MTIIVEDDDILIERMELGPFAANAYAVTCRESRESVLVDAPAQADVIIGKLMSATPRYILLTHSHIDHIGALDELRKALKIPLAAHAADSDGLGSPPDVSLRDGDAITLGCLRITVLHTPGHTPGSLCFRVGRYLISGDTVFPGGPGRTDSPAAFQQIVASIREKVLVLPDDTWIYPGHGEATMLKQERELFAVFAARPHDTHLCGDVLWLSG